MSCMRVAVLAVLVCATVVSAQIRVDVDLVLLQATVTDQAGRYVMDLAPERFRVWEDKVEQRIEYFSTENVPLTAGIVFDTSGSMTDKLPPARAAAETFLRMGNRDDEYFLIVFSDSLHLVQDFTTDISKFLSPLLFAKAKGSTALYDALYLGLDKVARADNPRKAILLITDGADNHSRYSLSNVREFAKEHDVMIFSIGILDPRDVQFSGVSGRRVLENLSDLTGGASFFPDSVDALDSICEQIGAELKNQYVLGYRSSNRAADSRWRKIRLAVDRPSGMPPLSVRTKRGYYSSNALTVTR